MLAKNRALRNAGIALGGVPVGFVLSIDSTVGFRLLFLVAGVLAAYAALLATRLPPTSVREVGRARAMLAGAGFVSAIGCLLLIAVPRTEGGRAVLTIALALIASRLPAGSHRS